MFAIGLINVFYIVEDCAREKKTLLCNRARLESRPFRHFFYNSMFD